VAPETRAHVNTEQTEPELVPARPVRPVRPARSGRWRRRLSALGAAVLVLGGAPAGARPSAAGALEAPLPQPPGVARAGEVVALAGTVNLWVGGEDGRYHWVGDSRALGQHPADWATRREAGAGDVEALPRGDPWLSVPLVRAASEEGAIFLPKWETDQPRPTLLHIRSIEDVRLFGISQDNWGRLVLEVPAWEAATGLPFGTLPRGDLPAAVAPAPAPAPGAGQPAVPVAGAEASPRAAWSPVPAEGELSASNRGYVTRTVGDVPWTWVPYWYLQSGRDERLMDALVVASTYHAEWRAEVGAKLAPAGTRITWGSLPAETLGTHRGPAAGGPGVIIVHSKLQGDLGGTAAVLAHEVFHAQYPNAERRLGTPEAVAACVREEAAAFEWETRVWVALPNSLKLASGIQEFMNRLVRLWLGGALQAAVSAEPSYQTLCASRSSVF
jgi:hypothetical protein